MDYIENNRMLSLLGQRGAFGTVLYDIAAKNENIVAVSADLVRTSGLERLYKDFPDRCINVGIAEQNAIGFASGLSDEGKIPFVTTFSNFAALRGNEFIRHFMAYMNCNVKVVGLSSGFTMGFFGNTHYGVEDIAVLRPFPNIVILSPADCLELAKCVLFCEEYNGPVYLRLSGGMNNPIVNKKDYKFEAGKGIVLKEGTDAVFFATGSMVSVSLKAAKKLDADGVSVKVINLHTIKPIDEEIIIENKDCPVIATVEEHAKTGGLGSSVSEILCAEKSHGRLIRIGADDTYYKAGTYEYMLEQHGLTVENIIKTVKENLR